VSLRLRLNDLFDKLISGSVADIEIERLADLTLEGDDSMENYIPGVA
jgi:hypothetical protein